MADPKNSGQFGNRSDTQQQASEGGKASGGKFKKNDSRASDAGKKGAQNEPMEARKRGGEHSHQNG